ncbi:MAG: hypothetical protein IIA85_02525 [Nanoarchaeota archaeon]|nr:hypothetical protein [Nanoarchaeota archaeon]
MINHKKGLSAIILTLIMILLAIVASGLVWVVIQNVVGGSTEQISLGTDCLNVKIVATKVVNTSTTGNYEVTLDRGSGGLAIGGVKLRFTNATGISDVVDIPGNIEPFERPIEQVVSTITNANKVEIIVYFKDTSGNEQACPILSSFDFVIQ